MKTLVRTAESRGTVEIERERERKTERQRGRETERQNKGQLEFQGNTVAERLQTKVEVTERKKA